MDQSKIDAAAVVLGILQDYPRAHGTGALIESTADRCPADGHLFPGDVVTAIDGEPIGSRAEASRISAAPRRESGCPSRSTWTGRPSRRSSARSGASTVSRTRSSGSGLIDTFPFPVQIASGEVGGPSAGLMWAVGLYELLTPGDLTAGRTIAGTGTIALDGSIGAIGGVVDKVLGARQAGAEVFLVPEANAPELAGVETGDMEVVAVATFEDALARSGRAIPRAEVGWRARPMVTHDPTRQPPPSLAARRGRHPRCWPSCCSRGCRAS